MLNQYALDELIMGALKEDIGNGDITTYSTVHADKRISGRFIAKEDGVICGLPVMKRVFELLDPDIKVEIFAEEGDFVSKSGVVAEIEGNARNILSGERVALNLLQHMSGIATATRRAVDAVAGTNASICDTRKTMPGMRALEKYAVTVGGGKNHRFNLSDAALIKDNHIDAVGSIKNAVEILRKNVGHMVKIEWKPVPLKSLPRLLRRAPISSCSII